MYACGAGDRDAHDLDTVPNPCGDIMLPPAVDALYCAGS